MRYQPGWINDSQIYDELMRIAVILEVLGDQLRVHNVEPEKPREGQTAICDGTNWNPLSDGIKRPVWFNGTAWSAF
jgi:hypothetical protein